MVKHVLVIGWFSFEKCKATAGDLIACDLVCDWLKQSGYTYQIAFASPFTGGVDCKVVDPDEYSHLVFVCGPFGRDKEVLKVLQRFSKCRLIGVDVSMLDSPEEWNPFDVLLERDSVRLSRPDITFLSNQKKAPVVGIILAHVQEEYGNRSRHSFVDKIIDELLKANNAAPVYIDTCLDPNRTNLRNSSEIEALIAKMDFVITTRLHGTVLSIKNGIPVIAIDAVSGGAKVSNQAIAINWPILFTVDDLEISDLQASFEYCQTKEAKDQAIRCRDDSIRRVEEIRKDFIDSLNVSPSVSMRVDHLSLEDLSVPASEKVYRKVARLNRKVSTATRDFLHFIGSLLLKV